MERALHSLPAFVLSSMALAAGAEPPPGAVPIRDKTLAAWVIPARLDQAGAGVLALEGPGDRFDAIVLGERAPRRWMAGSDGFRRTPSDQSRWPEETARAGTLVGIAVVYRGRQVTIYRDGVPYASYEMEADPASFGTGDSVLIGRRHRRAAEPACFFAGVIDDARIYDRALTSEEVGSLRPGLPSVPPPLAWWTFDGGRAEDRMGTFPASTLAGGARVEGGRLILDGAGSYAVFGKTPEPAPRQEPGLYHPPGMSMWDTWYLQRGDETHVFHLQLRRDEARPAEDHESIGHAVSRDLLRWKELPVPLRKGPKGSPDDSWALFTGCAVERGGTVYLFYCGNHQPGDRCRQSMCLATSPSADGIAFTRFPGNPVIEPDPARYYSIHEPPAPFRFHAWPHVDCRDLAVVPDPAGGGWLGYVMMRRKGQADAFGSACIALCRSRDLVRWEVGDPCCAPNRFNCFEVPDVFRLGGKWFLIALTGDAYGQSRRWSDPNITAATVVFQADRPEGPFEEVPDDLLLASTGQQGYSARTVERRGERLMLFTRSAEPFSRLAWPVKLVPRAGGGLDPVYWNGIDGAFGPPRSLPAAEVGEGADRETRQIPADAAASILLVEATVDLGAAGTAGIAFGSSPGVPGFAAEIGAGGGPRGRVLLRDLSGPVLQERHWPVLTGGSRRIRVVVVEQMADVYVDDVLAVNRWVPGLRRGSIGLTAEGGKASFRDIRIRSSGPAD